MFGRSFYIFEEKVILRQKLAGRLPIKIKLTLK